MWPYLHTLQERLIQALEALEARAGSQAQFLRDEWIRPPAASALEGHGCTAILERGTIFESAGINVSHVRGAQLPPSASAHRADLAGASFEAMGLSLVFHPRNPYVPTVHMNVRLFKTTSAIPSQDLWWFGGGYDLTPYFGFREDAVHWHQTAQQACAPFGADIYPLFKKNCDDYFYLKHRGECRGVGGLFFDDWSQGGWDQSLGLVESIGDSFIHAYQPIVERRWQTAYAQAERDFQCYRRGRYVEFNLLYDRGTLFGLQSGGRTASILMSLPPEVHWHYTLNAYQQAAEERLVRDFLQPRDWLALSN